MHTVGNPAGGAKIFVISLEGGAQWSEIKNLVQILQSLQNFEFISLVHKQTFFVKKKFP
jgi:hypothetical protein